MVNHELSDSGFMGKGKLTFAKEGLKQLAAGPSVSTPDSHRFHHGEERDDRVVE